MTDDGLHEHLAVRLALHWPGVGSCYCGRLPPGESWAMHAAAEVLSVLNRQESITEGYRVLGEQP